MIRLASAATLNAKPNKRRRNIGAPFLQGFGASTKRHAAGLAPPPYRAGRGDSTDKNSRRQDLSQGNFDLRSQLLDAGQKVCRSNLQTARQADDSRQLRVSSGSLQERDLGAVQSAGITKGLLRHSRGETRLA